MSNRESTTPDEDAELEGMQGSAGDGDDEGTVREMVATEDDR